MYPDSAELTLQVSSAIVIMQLRQILTTGGLSVSQSFDLQIARAAQTGCSCPHHGTQMCDCQMAILQVYGQSDVPITLVVHGTDGKTYVSIVNVPGQKPAEHLLAQVKSLLLSEEA